MLWYKSWRESRVRFLLSAAVLTFLCVDLIVRARSGFPPPERPDLPYSAWVWANIYGNLNPTIFVILAMMLGLGGLRRESLAGTAAYTLVLPVTRNQLVTTRAAVGLLEVGALALIPSLWIPTLSPLIAGQHYAVTQTLLFALLFMSWGAVAFALGFLCSTILAGEFTGAVLCVIVPVLYKILAASNSALQRYPAVNYGNFMSGFQMPYVHKWTVLLIGPLPWRPLLVLSAVALGLIGLAARVTRHQDY